MDAVKSFFNFLGGGPDEDLINKGVEELRAGAPQYGYYRINNAQFDQDQNNLYSQAMRQKYDNDLANRAGAQQQQATNLLANTAQGRGPSLANATLNRSLGSINNQLRAAAFSQQGNRGAGLTQRNLLNAQAAAANNAQANAGVASAQEQLGAQNALVGAASAQRAGDLAAANAAYGANAQRIAQASGISTNRYGAQRDQAQANMAFDAARQNNSANIANTYNGQAAGVGAGVGRGFDRTLDTAGGIGQLAAWSDMTMKENIAPLRSLELSQPHMIGISPVTPVEPQAKKEGGDKFMQGLAALFSTGGGAGGAGSAAGLAKLASDREIKRDVAPVENMLDKLKPYRFDYKDPERYGEGRRMGIMAQDAQKSDMGRQMVNDVPGEPLSIDLPKAVSASLASVAFLNDRLNKLERERHG